MVLRVIVKFHRVRSLCSRWVACNVVAEIGAWVLKALSTAVF